MKRYSSVRERCQRREGSVEAAARQRRRFEGFVAETLVVYRSEPVVWRPARRCVPMFAVPALSFSSTLCVFTGRAFCARLLMETVICDGISPLASTSRQTVC